MNYNDSSYQVRVTMGKTIFFQYNLHMFCQSLLITCFPCLLVTYLSNKGDSDMRKAKIFSKICTVKFTKFTSTKLTIRSPFESFFYLNKQTNMTVKCDSAVS